MRFDFPLFPESASTLASEVDALYFFALAVSAFFSLLITALALYLFTRYRRRPDGPQVGDRIHGSTLLEIVWSVIPLVIVMVLFVWGARVFYFKMVPPEDAVEYLATGKQWMWKFQHPEGQREINTLHVPLGQKIKITMTSEDVIHSLFIPAFRVKQDVLPGRYSKLWFEATKTGEYHLFCAEYCGAEHSRMIGTVYVMEPSEYEAWLAGGSTGLAPAEAGAELFAQFACNTCHETEGTGRGPSLHGIAGETVRLTSGRELERDDAYLRESITNPGAKIVEGYKLLMPTYQGQISEEGILHLIAYIKTLSQGEAAPAAEGP
jgi:cytochrome c oxidase subunit 2